VVSICLDGTVINNRTTTYRNGSGRIDVVLECVPDRSAKMRFEVRFAGVLGERATQLKPGDYIIANGRMCAVGTGNTPQVVVFGSGFELHAAESEPATETPQESAIPQSTQTEMEIAK
jgi:hypothetical protein